MKLLACICCLLFAASATVAQAVSPSKASLIVNYKIATNVRLSIPLYSTGGTKPALRLEGAVITFSNNLFGDPERPRQSVTGKKYDTYADEFIAGVDKNGLAEKFYVNVLNYKLSIISKSGAPITNEYILQVLSLLQETYHLSLAEVK